MGEISKSLGKLEVSVPDDSFEAGKICTARILIKNPFEVPVEILEINGPRSSTLRDLESEPTAEQNDEKPDKEKKRRRVNYKFSASIGKNKNIWSSILNVFGLTAEVIFGEVTSSRERGINILAEKNSEITIDQDIGKYDVVNIRSEESSKLNIKEPERSACLRPKVASIAPHCEVVQYFPFITSTWLLFKPVRLNVNVQIRYLVEGSERTQVISASLDVKPPITSMVFGALCGAVLGTLAKVFVGNQALSWGDLSVALGTSTVMSLIATVALMRKSGSQGFITVEDFFGSFVLGTLIGYSGPDYFEKALLPKSIHTG